MDKFNTIGSKHSGKMNKHKVHIDFLRLFAIFFVVYAHNRTAGGIDAHFYGVDFINEMIFQIRQMAVPFFFMISGALLLPKEENLVKVFTHRILRFLAALVVFWGIYVLANAIYLQEYTLKEILRVFKYVYTPSTSNSLIFTSGAMWFLYCYIAMLFLIPILRVLVKGCNSYMFVYLIGLQLIVCAILPMFHMLVFGAWVQPEISKYFPFYGLRHLPFGGGYCLFYIIIGYYAENRLILTKQQYIALFITSLLLLTTGAIISCGLKTCNYTAVSMPSVSFITIPIVTLYYGSKRFFETVQISTRTRNILSHLGTAVFTTMIVEGLLAGILSRYILPDMNNFSYIESLGVVSLIVLIGLCIGCICKRIPLLKDIL